MGKKPEQISDFDIQALVDGQLSGEEADAVRKALEKDPAKLERYHQLQCQTDLLRQWWKSFKQEN